ncbi:POMT1 [Cordylochernes scorpioides]|uniref:POMT1 n=1 Tax=Cordylochernes scorpioides TaxID=51811 RepID=A0ABY6LBI9_9ARAC|nr:POMT1 [Cordylochernes scorpioides]
MSTIGKKHWYTPPYSKLGCVASQQVCAEAWEKFWYSGLVTLGGFSLFLVPNFLTDRTLFLHHYLPSYLFKVLLLCSLLHHLDHLILLVKRPLVRVCLQVVFYLAVGTWLIAAAAVFWRFRVLSYGSPPLSSQDGGLASITKGQPLQVAHGSQITLRHSLGRPCWLHSHENVYPIKYPDGRGSSHQQQVTCYTFKDVNNWWIVKRPDKNDLMVSEPIDTVKHGDVIQLIHGMTSRALNSHDVAAPMSPQHQEVSCYIDYNINFTAQNQWKVDIVNRETEGDVWHTIHSQVRLVHLTTGQALKFSGKQLPDWGFHQHEVVTDKILNQDDTLWNVEEHRYTKSEDQKERERELGMAEFVPLQPTRLSFWEKFWELQVKMLSVNQEVVQDHVYTSDPFEWLLMTRGIAYWVSPDSNAQIHLLGNVVVWYSATLGLGIYLGLLALYLLRRQRGVYDISEPSQQVCVEAWEKFWYSGLVTLGGFSLFLVPNFLTDRTLFLHHYLPSYLFKVLLLCSLLHHLDHLILLVKRPLVRVCLQVVFYLAVGTWLIAAAAVFWRFRVLSYGSPPLSSQDVTNLRWLDTWDLLIHQP